MEITRPTFFPGVNVRVAVQNVSDLLGNAQSAQGPAGNRPQGPSESRVTEDLVLYSNEVSFLPHYNLLMHLIPFSPHVFCLTYLCINLSPSGASECSEAGLSDSCLYSQQHPARDLTHSRYSVMSEIIVKPEQHEPAYPGTGSSFANTRLYGSAVQPSCLSYFHSPLPTPRAFHRYPEVTDYISHLSYFICHFWGLFSHFLILTVKVEKYPHVFHINLYLCDTICYNFLL